MPKRYSELDPPTRLLLFGCSPSDTSQLWNLG